MAISPALWAGLIDKIRGRQVPTCIPETLPELNSLSHPGWESSYLWTAPAKLFFTLSKWSENDPYCIKYMTKAGLQIKTKYYTHCPGYL